MSKCVNYTFPTEAIMKWVEMPAMPKWVKAAGLDGVVNGMDNPVICLAAYVCMVFEREPALARAFLRAIARSHVRLSGAMLHLVDLLPDEADDVWGEYTEQAQDLQDITPLPTTEDLVAACRDAMRGDQPSRLLLVTYFTTCRAMRRETYRLFEGFNPLIPW